MNASLPDDTLLIREPVLDASSQLLVGYELSLQSARSDNDPAHTALLVCAAYAELGVRSALGNNKAFLAVDPFFLHDDAIEALPPEGVVLELMLDQVPDSATLERCHILRDRRYSLAFANYTGLDDRSRPLLAMLDVIKIDIRKHSGNELAELAGPLARLPLKLLAQGVDTQADRERCVQTGFQLLQGHYFARPELVSGRRLTASQASLIQLVNLAGRDADTFKIEDGFKREPALAANLLRIVNSVGYGNTRRISSLRHAITMLGRRQLQRWLQLLLMTPAGISPDASRAPLLQVAALRGRMMEMLTEHAHRHDRKLADQAFITGIMSMMPAALGLPMQEIFEQIALEPEVMNALESRTGNLGSLLSLLECYDSNDPAGCEQQLSLLPGTRIDMGMLNLCLMESLRWVNGNDE